MNKGILLIFFIFQVFWALVKAGNLTATHFWDCSGGACDSKTLQPWNQ